MPKSFRHLVQALACLALLASASLQAQESRSTASSRAACCASHHWRLQALQLPHGGGRLCGFDVDMAQRLAESLGAKLVVVPTSWPNLMRDSPTTASTSP
ncbi:cyclohexadienyl dehydratase [Pseudomonas aeruginosa]|nr:cyclohexadienyl dehydratase [Pseudomonas aeruginosa]